MNLMSRVAILAISAVPMYAQAQQSGMVKLKADAQNVVKIIRGDKLKTRFIVKSSICVTRSTMSMAPRKLRNCLRR